VREFELVGELSGFKDGAHAVRECRFSGEVPKLNERHSGMVSLDRRPEIEICTVMDDSSSIGVGRFANQWPKLELIQQSARQG
jgi:hypothetical protein